MSSICVQNDYGESMLIRITCDEGVIVSHSGWGCGQPGEFVDLGIPYGNGPRAGLLIVGETEYRLTTSDADCIRNAIARLSATEPASGEAEEEGEVAG